MKRKNIGAVCLLALMAIIGSLQACAEAQPDFEVLSLNITPPQITTGEKATIEVKIRNNDAKTINYNVPLMVNGVADDRKSLTLAPGAAESITFMLTKSHAGTYSIAVGNRESTLVVENPLPPEFRISNLEINPAEVDMGEKVVITARITNAGGTQGSYTAELKVDGVTNQTEELTVPAGTGYTLVFKICKCLPGTYIVTLGDLTGQFLVKEPYRPVIDNSPVVFPPSNPCSSGG